MAQGGSMDQIHGSAEYLIDQKTYLKNLGCAGVLVMLLV